MGTTDQNIMQWSATFSCLLLLIPLIFYITLDRSQSIFYFVYITPHSPHLSQKLPALLPAVILEKVKAKDDLAYFFSAFMDSEDHVTVLLVGHTSLKGKRWWCQIVTGEGELEGAKECFCSIHLLGLRNFQSHSWGVQRLECKFKSKGEGEVNSIRLRRGSKIVWILGNQEIELAVKTAHRGKTHNLGLCLAGPLWGKGNPTDLISFVEFYRELGVEGITVYKETNDFDISRVLAHYRREGFVREIAWDWSEPLPALLDYHGQSLCSKTACSETVGFSNSLDFLTWMSGCFPVKTSTSFLFSSLSTKRTSRPSDFTMFFILENGP